MVESEATKAELSEAMDTMIEEVRNRKNLSPTLRAILKKNFFKLKT